jgi:hypothetical protein
MQRRGVLVDHCSRLGAAVATRVIEIHRVDDIPAETTLKRSAAIQGFGRVVSHY